MITFTIISLSFILCLCSSAPTSDVSTAAVTSGPTTTRAPFVKLSCKGHNPNGFFVDEKDPQKFHECVNGEHIADFVCPGKLVFSENLQVCVGQSGPQTTQEPGHTVPDLKCPEPTGIFPYPGDRHKFIECNERTPYIFSCPGSLVFDPVSKNCVYDTNPTNPTSPPQTVTPTKGPETVATGGTSGPTVAPTVGPTGGPTTQSPSVTTQSSGTVDCSKKDGYFADPSDKHQYIICSKGKATVMKCPNGTVFNEQLEMCS